MTLSMWIKNSENDTINFILRLPFNIEIFEKFAESC